MTRGGVTAAVAALKRVAGRVAVVVGVAVAGGATVALFAILAPVVTEGAPIKVVPVGVGVLAFGYGAYLVGYGVRRIRRTGGIGGTDPEAGPTNENAP